MEDFQHLQLRSNLNSEGMYGSKRSFDENSWISSSNV